MTHSPEGKYAIALSYVNLSGWIANVRLQGFDESILHMDITFVFAVALSSAIIVVLLVLITIIIYQRWRIGEQNVFIERFIRQNEELRQKMRKAGILIIY